MWDSFESLMYFITGEEWTSSMTQAFHVQPKDCPKFLWNLLVVSFYCMFMVLTNLLVLNMFIMIVVSSYELVGDEELGLAQEDILAFQQVRQTRSSFPPRCFVASAPARVPVGSSERPHTHNFNSSSPPQGWSKIDHKGEGFVQINKLSTLAKYLPASVIGIEEGTIATLKEQVDSDSPSPFQPVRNTPCADDVCVICCTPNPIRLTSCAPSSRSTISRS